MIITLTKANFANSKITTLDSWYIKRELGNGVTYDCPDYVKAGAELKATFTLADGYEIGAAGGTVTMGGETISPEITINGSSITITIASVTGNVVIKIPTKNVNTGEEDEGGDAVDPETPTNTSVFYGNYTHTANVQLASSGSDPYAVETKTNYYTFFDIPVEPNTVYYIEGSVRVTSMNSEKARVDSTNVFSASNVGQQYYYKTPSSAAYINVTILTSKVDLEKAKLSTTTQTRTIAETTKIADTGAIFVDNTKYSSSNYTEQTDELYYVWKEIPVEASTYYHLKGAARVWFLKEDKTKISSVNPGTGGVVEKYDIMTPSTAAYVSAGFYKSTSDAADDAQLVKLTVQFAANE